MATPGGATTLGVVATSRAQPVQYVAAHWYIHFGHLADARRAAGLNACSISGVVEFAERACQPRSGVDGAPQADKT